MPSKIGKLWRTDVLKQHLPYGPNSQIFQERAVTIKVTFCELSHPIRRAHLTRPVFVCVIYCTCQMRYLLGCMRYQVMCDMWCVGEMGVQIETNHFYCSDPNRRHRYQLRLCLRQKSLEQLVRKSAMCKEWSFSPCIPFNFFEPNAAVGCKIGRGTVCVINKILCHIG